MPARKTRNNDNTSFSSLPPLATALGGGGNASGGGGGGGGAGDRGGSFSGHFASEATTATLPRLVKPSENYRGRPEGEARGRREKRANGGLSPRWKKAPNAVDTTWTTHLQRL
mmetsp:Transcript_13738/g.31496  ORF Transcript_13738/g.31496 Transcript_13738/m.31496 type:complete len:113 (-) Transcript_13738:725-1063(-)